MKKTMKKVLALVLTVLMCVSVALPVVAADAATCPGADKPEDHDKTHGTVVSTTPSICGEDGYTVYECNTCHVYFLDDIVLATGAHKYENTGAVVAATCTAEGYKICDICGYKTKTADKLNHSYGAWTLTGDDCDADVVTEKRTCTRSGCNASETRTRETALGDHDWALVNVIKAPTCSVAGSGNFKCDTCDLEKTLEIAPTENHKFTVYLNAKPATCTEDGNYAGYACAECGAYQFDSMHIPAGHQMQVDVNGHKDATCTSAGYTLWYCTVCGENDAVVEKPLGHNRGALVSYVAATCVAPGSRTYEHACTNSWKDESGATVNCDCGAVDNLPQLATHTFAPVVHPATCQRQGYTQLECQVEGCRVTSGEPTNLVPVNPDNHEWVDEILVDATCAAAGQKTRWCVCGAHQDAVVIPKLDHNYNTLNADDKKTSTATPSVVAPNCVDGDGYVLWTCVQCIADNAETPAQFKDYSATKDNVDLSILTDEDAATLRAGLKYDAGNSNHHDFDMTLGMGGVLGTDRTNDCTAVAYNKYFCKDCQKLVSIAIEGTGAHLRPVGGANNYDKVNATCITEGYAEFWKCAREGCEYWEGAQTKNGEYVYATGSTVPERIEYAVLGHKNYVAGKAATCTEAGYKATWDCDRCNTKSTVAQALEYDPDNGTYVPVDYVINALGHVWGGDYSAVVGTDTIYYNVLVKANVCGDYGYTNYVCTREDCMADKIGDFVYIDHVWSDTVVEATCETGAYKSCTLGCGAKNYQSEKLGHLDKNGNVVKCATATFTCYRVGCTGVDYKTTHNYAVTIVEATCKANSYNLYQCKDCTYHIKEELNLTMLEHTYAADPNAAAGTSTVTIGGKTWTVTKAPTYKAAGSKYQLCTACGDKKVDDNYVKTDMQITFDTTNAKNNKADIVNSGLIAVTVKTTSYKLPIWGLELSMAFNNQVVEFAGYEVNNAAFKDTTKVAAKNVVSDGITTQGYVDRADIVTIAAYAPNGTDGKAQNIEVNGEKVAFVTVYFRVLDNVTPGTVIAFTTDSSVVEVVKKDASEVTVSSIGTIASKTVMALGDVNKDADHTAAGYATIQDAIALKLLVEKNDGSYNAMADIDKDGKVTVADFGYLMQYISGEIAYNELCAIGVKA